MKEIKLDKVLSTGFLEGIRKELKEYHGPLILSGFSDDVFCAGADIKFLTTADKNQLLVFFEGLVDVLTKLWHWEDIVICKAAGKAVGGGVGFFMVADLCFAKNNFIWRLSEVGFGFGPYVISPFISVRIGYHNLMSIAGSGRWIDFSESRSMNLIVDEFEADYSNLWFRTSKSNLKPRIQANFDELICRVTESVLSERVRGNLLKFISK